MTTAAAGLTDEQCDAIRNECNREWIALPISEYHYPPWEHRLIRAGFAAAQVPREPVAWLYSWIGDGTPATVCQLKRWKPASWDEQSWVESPLYDAAQPAAQDHPEEYMCPNCVTPWKCNGPHIPQDQSGETQDVSAEKALIPDESTRHADGTKLSSPVSPDPYADLLRRLDMIYDTDEIRNGYRDVRWEAAAAIRALQDELADARRDVDTVIHANAGKGTRMLRAEADAKALREALRDGINLVGGLHGISNDIPQLAWLKAARAALKGAA
jgi:hypothetical protein